jgi:hypothetical protein
MRMRAIERLGSERGAVFVQVGIAVFVLMAFNVFVLDYGMVWIARQQAQNAADAGALAGAVARGYDDFDPTPSFSGTTAQIAKGAAAANMVWNAPATADVSSFDCPVGAPPGRCVRVDVYRDGSNGSTALPTIFGPILGVMSQGVRATATGLSGNGNATNCLRPLALPDKWTEVPGTTPNEYNGYDGSGNPLPPPNQDIYSAPGTLIAESGLLIGLQLDRNPMTSPITRGFMVSLDLGGTYVDEIKHCSGQMTAIGGTIPVLTPVAGTTQAALTTDADSLVSQDPLATWDESTNRIVGSCAPGCAAISPLLIPVVLFDPADFQQRRSSGNWGSCGGPCVRVSNIAGLYIHNNGILPRPHGHLLRYPGFKVTSPGTPTYLDDDNASWLITTSLIR